MVEGTLDGAVEGLDVDGTCEGLDVLGEMEGTAVAPGTVG